MASTGEIIKARLEQLAPSSTEEKITPASYEYEVLTAEETSEALRVAREKKYNDRLRAEYFDRVRQNPVFKQYTAAELLEALKLTRSMSGRQFVVSPENQEQIMQLCFYFANDKRFNGDLNKGLLLMGKLGTGKTHTMAFFQQNQNASFGITKARTIENAWINEKEDQEPKVIDYYSAIRKLAINENRFGHQEAGLCLDDMGSESLPSKRYGEEKNVISEVILNRYDNRLPFNMTHITTNLTAEEIERHYGSRVRERLREMMNVITFDGDGWR